MSIVSFLNSMRARVGLGPKVEFSNSGVRYTVTYTGGIEHRTLDYRKARTPEDERVKILTLENITLKGNVFAPEECHARAAYIEGSVFAKDYFAGMTKIIGNVFTTGFFSAKGVEIGGDVSAPKWTTLEATSVKGNVVAGCCFCESTCIQGKTTILDSTDQFTDQFTARWSYFNDLVTIESAKSDFISCFVKDILVKANPHSKEPEIVALINGTVVAGDITFESGNGKVLISPFLNVSRILGKVNGGTVQRIDE